MLLLMHLACSIILGWGSPSACRRSNSQNHFRALTSTNSGRLIKCRLFLHDLFSSSSFSRSMVPCSCFTSELADCNPFSFCAMRCSRSLIFVCCSIVSSWIALSVACTKGVSVALICCASCYTTSIASFLYSIIFWVYKWVLGVMRSIFVESTIKV